MGVLYPAHFNSEQIIQYHAAWAIELLILVQGNARARLWDKRVEHPRLSFTQLTNSRIGGSYWHKKSMQMPSKAVLIIGNGFDLDLGLKTKYSDFAASEEWEDMYAKESIRSTSYSLLKYLNDRKDTDNWFDIEQALLEYAHIKTKSVWSHDVKTDQHEYRILCKTLVQYLDKHINSQNRNLSNTFAAEVLRCFQYNSELRKIYTSNFTPLDLFIRVIPLLHPVPFTYIHGSIKDHNIIVGFETNHLESIIPDYSFLLKSNHPSYQHTQMHQDMIDADEVIIFGHSLNRIDSVLFEDYFRELTIKNDINRRLTIITKDESSRQNILMNIRNMGISVPKLYSRAKLEFILTEQRKEKEKYEKHFVPLLQRIEIFGV